MATVNFRGREVPIDTLAQINNLLRSLKTAQLAGTDEAGDRELIARLQPQADAAKAAQQQGMQLLPSGLPTTTDKTFKVQTTSDLSGPVEYVPAPTAPAPTEKTDPALQRLFNKLRNDPTNPVLQQAIDERQGALEEKKSSQSELEQLRNKFETQIFGGVGLSLAEALKNPQGDLSALNQALGEQGSAAFKQILQPLIQGRLAGQGLFEGGAQIEQQAKGFGEVERARQAGVLQAALGARSQLQGLQRSDVISGIEQSQANLNSIFGLQRADITMKFKQILDDKRNELAKELFQMSRPSGSSDFLNYAQGALGIFSAAKSIF